MVQQKVYARKGKIDGEPSRTDAPREAPLPRTRSTNDRRQREGRGEDIRGDEETAGWQVWQEGVAEGAGLI